MAATVNNTLRADVNFIAYKGDTFNPVLTFTDAIGDPLSFAGCTLLMQIKKGANQLAELSEGDGFSIASNVVTFSKVLDFKEGEYSYDFQCTYPDGLVKTLIGGTFTLQSEVTIPA
jgi:hypothetical protein